MRVVVGFTFWCHGAQKLLGLFPGPMGPMHPHGLLLVAGIIELTAGEVAPGRADLQAALDAAPALSLPYAAGARAALAALP